DSLELSLLDSLSTLLLVSVLEDDLDSLVSFFFIFFDSFFTFLATFSDEISLFLPLKLGMPIFQTIKEAIITITIIIKIELLFFILNYSSNFDLRAYQLTLSRNMYIRI